MHYRKFLILALLLTLLFACGDSETVALSLQGPAGTITAPSYKLRGTTYVPLKLVCESYGLEWEWDSIGKVVVLKKNNVEARLKVDSYKIYVNGKIKIWKNPRDFIKI